VSPRAGDPQRARLVKGLKPVVGQDDDAGTPARCSRAAGATVRATWRDQRGDAVDSAEAMQLLEWLVTAAQHAAWGGVPEHAGPAANPLGRHLLEQLRAELVRAWRPRRRRPRRRRSSPPSRRWNGCARRSTPTGRSTSPRASRAPTASIWSWIWPTTSAPPHVGAVPGGDAAPRQSGPVSDLQRRQLRLIYSAALGLSTLTADVIELARGGDQLADKEAEPFSLAELLETLHDLVRPVAEEKGLQVRYSVSTSDHRVGRPLALSRVLLNLTTNALKFTDEGYVEITTKAKGLSRVEFAVRDTGRGMSPEAATNLYLPFRRSRSRKGRAGTTSRERGWGWRCAASCWRRWLGAEVRVQARLGHAVLLRAGPAAGQPAIAGHRDLTQPLASPARRAPRRQRPTSFTSE